MEMMLTGLATLPVELSQSVFDQLDDRAIWALRLASTSLQIATIHHFRKAFAHRTTDLSINSLQTLVDICEHRHLSSAVQNLTIVATYYDTAYLQKVLDTGLPYKVYNDEFGPIIHEGHDPCSEVELAETAAHVDLLEQRKIDQASSALSQSDLMLLTTVLRGASNLRTLKLESGLFRHPETRLAVSEARNAWPQVWKRATDVYQVTMTAIAQSGTSIEELYIYGGQWGCSVPGYDVHASISYLRGNGIEAVLANLRILSLSCTTRLIEPVRPFGDQEVPSYHSRLKESNQRLVALATDSRNYLGPAHLLALCHNLEELELVHYRLRAPDWCSHEDFSAYYAGYEKVFNHIAQIVRLPRLLKCTIRGHTFDQYAILQFLKNSPLLKHLELRFVNFTGPGTWRSVFEQCKKLDTLILRHLFEHLKVVHFGGKSGGDEAYNLTANHDQLQRGIDYAAPQYQLNSLSVVIYGQERRREHGPPQ